MKYPKRLRSRLLRRRFYAFGRLRAGRRERLAEFSCMPKFLACFARDRPEGRAPVACRQPEKAPSSPERARRHPAFPRPFPQRISKVCCIYKIWKSAFGGQKSVKILHTGGWAVGYGKAVCRRLRARISQEDAPGRSTRPFHAFVQTAGFVCAGSASIPSR